MRNKSMLIAAVLVFGSGALVAAFVMMLISHRSLPQKTPGPEISGTAKSVAAPAQPTTDPAIDPFAAAPTAAAGAKSTKQEPSPAATAPAHSPVAAAIVAGSDAAKSPVVGTIKVPTLPGVNSPEIVPAAADPLVAALATTSAASVPAVLSSPIPAAGAASPVAPLGASPTLVVPSTLAPSAALGNAVPNGVSGMNVNAPSLDPRSMMPAGSIALPLSIGQGTPIQPAPITKTGPTAPASPSPGRFRVGEATITLPGQP